MDADDLLYESKFLRIKRSGRWEYVERANARAAVIILAVTDAGELLLVEQHRQPLHARVLELPAGLVGDIPGEENEELGVAAARELEEETGYRAATFDFLTVGPPSAGLTSELIYLYRARGLTQVGAGGGVEGEQITPHAVPLATIDGWLAARRGEGIHVDPKIYAGLYFVSRDSG